MVIDKENISRLLLMDNEFIGRVVRALCDANCTYDDGVMFAVKLIKIEQEKLIEKRKIISDKRRLSALQRMK